MSDTVGVGAWRQPGRAAPSVPSVIERRVAATASLHAALAFAAAACFPVVLFVLGPVAFGVPHVAAGMRHLVLRRTLSTSWQGVLLTGCLALFGLRLTGELVHTNLPRLETAVVLSWAAAAIVSSFGERRSLRRVLVAAVILALWGTASWRWPSEARLALLHLHNVLALAAVFIFRDRLGALRAPVAMTLGLAALLASGAMHHATLALGARAFGVHVLQAADWIAPALRADHAIGALTAYVFLQLMHYSIWLYVIPSQDGDPARLGERSGPGWLQPLKRRARGVYRDLRLPGVALVGLAVVVMVAGSGVDLHRTRAVYLSLATFHVYLEGILLTRRWIRGRSAATRGALVPAARSPAGAS